MHFVFGGAFNGKSSWVKEYYNKENVKWLSAYAIDFEKENFEHVDAFKETTILQGIEYYIKEIVQSSQEVDETRKYFNAQCSKWLAWENSSALNKLIIIGNDLSKGIVPIEKEDRTWRDVTGWCYQDLTVKSNRVDLIWYGMSNRLK